jgi:formylmethanofuran dehydrogenase subunit D
MKFDYEYFIKGFSGSKGFVDTSVITHDDVTALINGSSIDDDIVEITIELLEDDIEVVKILIDGDTIKLNTTDESMISNLKEVARIKKTANDQETRSKSDINIGNIINYGNYSDQVRMIKILTGDTVDIVSIEGNKIFTRTPQGDITIEVNKENETKFSKKLYMDTFKWSNQSNEIRNGYRNGEPVIIIDHPEYKSKNAKIVNTEEDGAFDLQIPGCESTIRMSKSKFKSIQELEAEKTNVSFRIDSTLIDKGEFDEDFLELINKTIKLLSGSGYKINSNKLLQSALAGADGGYVSIYLDYDFYPSVTSVAHMEKRLDGLLAGSGYNISKLTKYNLIIKSKDNDIDKEVCLHGKCGVFAIALSEVSGLPVYATYEHDNDIGKDALVHAYVRPNESDIIDIKGTRDRDWALQEFPGEDTWEQKASYSDILKIGGGDMKDVKSMIPHVQHLWDSGKLKEEDIYYMENEGKNTINAIKDSVGDYGIEIGDISINNLSPNNEIEVAFIADGELSIKYFKVLSKITQSELVVTSPGVKSKVFINGKVNKKVKKPIVTHQNSFSS